MEKKNFKIISKKKEEDCLFLVLSPIDGKNIKFKAGQFVKISSLDKTRDPNFRFYSIASSPSLTNLEFIIKIVGRFTNYLDSLKEGDELEIEGPYGHFSFSEKITKALFIAGGIGVAPMRGILQHIYRNNIKGDFIFFYSNRTRNFPYYKEFLEMNKNPNINIIFTITRENPEGWKGELGRVNKEMISKHLPSSLKDYTAFICGTVKMADEMKTILNGLGVDRVNMEAWG